MKQIKIIGGEPLSGTIRISGAKNSAVALIPASILSDDVVNIDNIPNISDIDALKEILKYLGAKVKLEDGVILGLSIMICGMLLSVKKNGKSDNSAIRAIVDKMKSIMDNKKAIKSIIK